MRKIIHSYVNCHANKYDNLHNEFMNDLHSVDHEYDAFVKPFLHKLSITTAF